MPRHTAAATPHTAAQPRLAGFTIFQRYAFPTTTPSNNAENYSLSHTETHLLQFQTAACGFAKDGLSACKRPSLTVQKAAFYSTEGGLQKL